MDMGQPSSKKEENDMIERPIVEIAPKTWLISDYKLDNFYLLEGEEKALLIDTGACQTAGYGI